MMNRTVVSIGKATSLINKNDKVITFGSCFSDMIAAKLRSNKWQVLSNPFGTIYDPPSIARCLQLSLDDSQLDENLFLQREDVHSHFFFHSDMTALSKEALSKQIDTARKLTRAYLQDSNWLIITLGSSIAYQHVESQSVVANCHKMPGNQFSRVQLSQEQVLLSLGNIITTLQDINPSLKIIATVSPVRHTRQGLLENMVSKSILRLSCDVLQNEFNQVSYFPAYEIMLDELRDYQHYEADLIHPNKAAQDYIWAKFSENYLTSESLSFVQKWGKLQQLLNHKALLPSSSAHQKFLKNTLQQLIEMSSEVDLKQEIELIKNQINDVSQ